ncbi:MAG: hypothetical protein EOR34_04015 [Mesorhizobium sp.]|nr:MAG: hypothetical protein EOR14_04280 [Mesorhizobium sp.]RWJ75606.1 MAG: hypothetical protein EOR34_04015 [Mesorhizobium sp.]
MHERQRVKAGPFGPLADNLVTGDYVRRTAAMPLPPQIDGLPIGATRGGDASCWAEMRRDLAAFSGLLARPYAGQWDIPRAPMAAIPTSLAEPKERRDVVDPHRRGNCRRGREAFLATHVLSFRACYACYNVSDAALDKAMAAAGGWVPLDPRLLWPYSSVPDEEVAMLAEDARMAFPEW